MRQKIDCCADCKPPKRNGYCHTNCPEYLKQRAELDAANEEKNSKVKTQCNIFGQKIDGVNRANKKRRS